MMKTTGLEGIMYDGTQKLASKEDAGDAIVFSDSFTTKLLFDKTEYALYTAATPITCITMIDSELVIMFEEVAIRIMDQAPIVLPGYAAHTKVGDVDYCCSFQELYSKKGLGIYQSVTKVRESKITHLAKYVDENGKENLMMALREGYVSDPQTLKLLSLPTVISGERAIQSVVQFQGQIYKIQHNQLFTSENHLLDITSSKTKNSLNQLAVHNGQLIVGDADGEIINVMADKRIHKTNNAVTKLISVPRHIAIETLTDFGLYKGEAQA